MKILKTHKVKRYLEMKISFSTAVLGLLLGICGCSTMEGPEIISISPSETVSRISIKSDFVMIQVGDTLSLGVTVHALDKSELVVSTANISWISQDTSQLEVSNSGQIKAKIANSLPIRVIVSYRQNLNTVKDTVEVYITSNRLEGSNIRLVLLDSNRVGAAGSFFGLGYPRVRIDILDNMAEVIVKGAQIPILTPSPVTNRFIATGGDDKEPVYEVMNDVALLGKFWVKSSVNLYGTPVSDSIQFVGIYPVTAAILAFNIIAEDQNGLVIPRILDTAERGPQIQPCGVFSIMNFTSRPFDVVFSDSTSVGICDELPSSVYAEKIVGGNILNLGSFAQGVRRVRTTGVINYYLRDAITKERLPISGRYESVEVSN